MSGSGKVHGHAGFFGSLDDLFVPDGSTRVDGSYHSGLGQVFQTVGEGEECVGSRNGALGTVKALGQGVGPLYSQMTGIDSVDLAHTDAHGCTIMGQKDGIGLD